MADEGMKVTVDGKEYELDDFDGRELVDAEQSFGISLFSELDRGSVTGIYAILYLIKKRANPAFKPQDALALKIGEVNRMMGDSDDPPPVRAKGAK